MDNPLSDDELWYFLLDTLLDKLRSHFRSFFLKKVFQEFLQHLDESQKSQNGNTDSFLNYRNEMERKPRASFVDLTQMMKLNLPSRRNIHIFQRRTARKLSVTPLGVLVLERQSLLSLIHQICYYAFLTPNTFWDR